MERIENYNLFGERSDLPDVVHCETIETRSQLHDWEFLPHRHSRLHQFLLIESGGGRAQFESDYHNLAPGKVVNMPMGAVHGFSFLPGTHGWVVTLASELLEETLRSSEGLGPLLSEPRIISSSGEIRQVVQAIFREYPTRDFARAQVLRSLSGLLAGLVARGAASDHAVKPRPGHALHKRFEILLDQHFRDHLGVSDYAAKLAVSPTHLSRVMRQVTGRSASAAIEERLIREARRNLAYSNLSIAETGYLLGYNDPAYFSRVFSRATGMTPRAFRGRIGMPTAPTTVS